MGPVLFITAFVSPFSASQLFCYMARVVLLCTLASNAVAQVPPPAPSAGKSSDRKVTYEILGSGPATIILLHGASGLALPLYREQAALYASHGYRVFLPHFFEATGSASPSSANYQKWVDEVADLVSQARQNEGHDHSRVYLVGYSLGASVALAAGSQGVPVTAIADFYGSLPDEFFYKLQGMPPLIILHGERDTNIPVVNALQLLRLCAMRNLTCEKHLYPDQGHGFGPEVLEDADRRVLSFFAQQQ